MNKVSIYVSAAILSVVTSSAPGIGATLMKNPPGMPPTHYSADGIIGVQRHPTDKGCPAENTWPGPQGTHYLNEFNDGKCGYKIIANSFSSLTMTAGTWTMEGDVTVKSGGTVTISSGATLIDTFHHQPGGRLSAYLNVDGTLDFEQGSSFSAQCDTCAINVSSLSSTKGTLIVNGSTAAPVSFSGPASWAGILLQDNSTATIKGMQFSGGGASPPCRCGTRHAGITISGAKSASITDSSIDGVTGNGMEVSAGTPVTAHALALTHNTGYAIQYDFLSPALSQLSALTMSGNGHDVIHSVSGTAGSYNTNVRWPNVGYPLSFDIWVTVRPGATLTVDPGTTVEFGSGDQFFIKGTIHMEGTQTAPITVTSNAPAPTPGSWPGIEFDAAKGTLTYVHEAYAGALLQCGCGARHAGIVIDASRPVISHTRIDHVAGNDVEISHAGLPVMGNDRFEAVPSHMYGVVVDGWKKGNPTVDAMHSWWSDKTGPRAPGNTGGKGTPASTGVRYSPWLTTAPSTP